MDVDDDDDDVWQTIEKEGLSGNNCLNQLEYCFDFDPSFLTGDYHAYGDNHYDWRNDEHLCLILVPI